MDLYSAPKIVASYNVADLTDVVEGFTSLQPVGIYCNNNGN